MVNPSSRVVTAERTMALDTRRYHRSDAVAAMSERRWPAYRA